VALALVRLVGRRRDLPFRLALEVELRPVVVLENQRKTAVKAQRSEQQELTEELQTQEPGLQL